MVLVSHKICANSVCSAPTGHHPSQLNTVQMFLSTIDGVLWKSSFTETSIKLSVRPTDNRGYERSISPRWFGYIEIH